MSKVTFYYTVDIWDHGVDKVNLDWCHEFEYPKVYDEWDIENLAEACAEDYFDNHDGWEVSTWQDGGSVPVYVYDAGKTLIGKYNVTVEYSPSFYASKIK